MGLGRFGVGGCCICGPDNPDDPGGGGSTNAGVCGWCGLNVPGETTLELPIPPDKLCHRQVYDAFDYSKDFPRVPYWNYQTDIGQPGWTWRQKWFQGDYQHLDAGHFLSSSRGRYAPLDSALPRHAHLSGKLVDTYCKPNQAAGGDSGAWLWRLVNHRPHYGEAWYEFPKRYENGLLLNSPTDKTDLLPLRQEMRLEFNQPLNQWPKYLWNYAENYPVACLEPPCTYTTVVASSHARLVDAYNSDYQCNGDSHGAALFTWNQPSQPGPGGLYGLHVKAFSVRAYMRVPVEGIQFGNSTMLLDDYLPTEQEVLMHYGVGQFNGSGAELEGEGYHSFAMPYKNNFSLSVEVVFENWPADTRKCMLTVKFKIDNSVVYQNQHLIAKPGWKQNGSSTDEQSYVQAFCPGYITAVNEIIGTNQWAGSTAPWYRESFVLWNANQTPRESFYIDSWFAEYERL